MLMFMDAHIHKYANTSKYPKDPSVKENQLKRSYT